jgi:hypothetical protein
MHVAILTFEGYLSRVMQNITPFLDGTAFTAPLIRRVGQFDRVKRKQEY